LQIYGGLEASPLVMLQNYPVTVDIMTSRHKSHRSITEPMGCKSIKQFETVSGLLNWSIKKCQRI